MSTVFDDNGLTISTLSEVLLAIANRYKAAYGDNVRVDDPDGVVGRHARILSEVKHDILTELAATVAGLTPSTSSGTLLEELVKFNGITRNVASKSTATVTITANSAGCTVPSGSLVATADGVQFETDSELVVGGGLSDYVTVTAVEDGAQAAAAGTITTILTPIYGWASVTNANDATAGDARETDPQLRARRWQRAQGTGSHSKTAIESALLDLDGVTKAKVIENKGSSTSDEGVPGHALWVIVAGGTDQEIADSLYGPGYGSVGGGIGTWGADKSVIPTGGDDYIKWDVADPVNIYVTVETYKIPGEYPSGGDDAIAEAIVDFFNGELEINDVAVEPFDLGDDVTVGRLYTPCNSVPGHWVRNIYISKSASPTTSTDIDIANNEYAITDTTKITVTQVSS